ncbi:hypothetical protein IE4872_PB00120 (plasmid) [Rhizobium gallicum]|uniref:Uncharacterized protein n=2 Tax=Rhizobium gallicum TaxID=56730 RepID=A0A0B4X5Z8_9HYPH|nr:hypothetical protein RGR602_PA00154 [Rhizobium gallicum bv. gallicum R602sp]APO69991.1 hypothetical protein IE4872_PB00120 [Rhizobium gallicum]
MKEWLKTGDIVIDRKDTTFIGGEDGVGSVGGHVRDSVGPTLFLMPFAVSRTELTLVARSES